jgi:hypothetical protein
MPPSQAQSLDPSAAAYTTCHRTLPRARREIAGCCTSSPIALQQSLNAQSIQLALLREAGRSELGVLARLGTWDTVRKPHSGTG